MSGIPLAPLNLPEVCPWLADVPLSQLSLELDWDYAVSNFTQLRLALLDHGVIPTWNFYLCGGKPELASPHGWAFTWLSSLAYALPGIYGVLAQWVIFTIVGFWAVRHLLRKWFDSPIAANMGASIYVFNGYFAARFYAGHQTFSLFHMVPVLMIALDRVYDRLGTGRSPRGALAIMTLLSFMFFSTALPHPLFTVYPIFLAYAIFRVATSCRTLGVSVALNRAIRVMVAHALGLVLAIYKLGPVVAWQLVHPRDVGHPPESLTLRDLVEATLRIRFDFHQTEDLGPRFMHPIWEYHAFVGPVLWIVALAGAAACFLVPRAEREHEPSEGRRRQLMARFALALLVAGFLAALGNGNPMSPFYYIRDLPLFSGIRGYSRYIVIALFALSALAAYAVSIAERQAVTKPQRLAIWFIAIMVCAPGIVQSVGLIKSMRAVKREDVARVYASMTGETLAPRPSPLLINTSILRQVTTSYSFQDTILRNGHLVLSCYEAMNIRRLEAYGNNLALSEPIAPTHMALTQDSIRLHFPPGLVGGAITVNVPISDDFVIDPKPEAILDGRATFKAEAVSGRDVIITSHTPFATESLAISGFGVLLTGIFFTWGLRSRSPEKVSYERFVGVPNNIQTS